MSADLDWVDAKLADPADIDPVDCRVIAEELSKELRSTRAALAEAYRANDAAHDQMISLEFERDELGRLKGAGDKGALGAVDRAVTQP